MEEVKCYMPQTLAEALQIRKRLGPTPGRRLRPDGGQQPAAQVGIVPG